MKGLDVSNSRLIKIVAMFLATTVVVGIVSSSAIRLVAATYYMQTKRKLTTNIPVVNQIIDAVVGDSNIAGPVTPEPDTTAPATTEAPTTPAPATTEAPATEPDTTEAPAGDESTTAPTTAASGSSGGAGDILGTITGLLGGIDIGGIVDGIGGAIGGIPAPESTTTTESTTESAESIAQKKEVLAKYNTVVQYAKKVGKPAFTKVTYRTFDKGFTDALLMHSVQSANPDYFISKENAEAAPIVVQGGKPTTELLINNDYYAGMLATADAGDAIKSATSVKLEDGSQKITITLRDEVDPAVTAPDAKKAASFTSAMFPVITSDDFAGMVSSGLSVATISSSSLTYKDCTVELIFNPILNRIVSIKQTTTYVGSVKASILSAKGTVTEVSEYRDFDYGIL